MRFANTGLRQLQHSKIDLEDTTMNDAGPNELALDRAKVRSGRGGAFALGALALGAFALGAAAVGSLAIGALAVRRVQVGQARIQRLRIDELRVGALHVEELEVSRRLTLPKEVDAQKGVAVS
ncbi:MAG TPA: hypothetical protein VEJ41_10105 [Candidatus Acidoferrales bacterium]|nr:hypothetical protein [Candidatus Acidoferrales bacterium]